MFGGISYNIFSRIVSIILNIAYKNTKLVALYHAMRMKILHS